MSPSELNCAPEPCRWCNGSGVNNGLHRRHPGGACRACGGVGTILVWQPARPCPSCAGTGVHNAPDPIFRSIPCCDCSGTGWMDFLRNLDPE